MALSSLKTVDRSVFLSHNRCQKPWVRRVAEQWRALGLEVFFDEDSIKPGENVVKALERGISKSTHVVLFLSPASLESHWVALEIAMTQIQDPAATDRRLIPVLVEPMELGTISPSIRCLSIVNLTDEQSRDDRYRYLLQSLLGSTSAELPPPPPSDPEVSRVPTGDNSGQGTNKDGAERGSTDVGQVGLELTIRGTVNEFTPEQQSSLLRAIQALLETGDEIRIRSIRRGSILLTLDLSPEEAERLYGAVQRGALDRFGVKAMQYGRSSSLSPVSASLPQLGGIDYVELYVGNAYQAAHFFRTMFGFKPVARAGLETGLRDRLSIVMEQGDIRLVLTSGLDPDSPIARQAALHGDGVKDVAFRVKDVDSVFETAVRRGARPVSEPRVHEDEHGRLVRATIAAPGNMVHSLVERHGDADTLFPGFETITDAPATRPTGFVEVDHVSMIMEQGQLDHWVTFYKDVLGFHQSYHEQVWTRHSAMNSKVVEDASGKIKFSFAEPAGSSGGKSQVQEYLNFNHGAGAQHLSFLSNDIYATVRAIRENGVRFLRIPGTYYEVLEERVGAIEPPLMVELQELGILVDSDDDGRLLQIFSEPIMARPTMFVEVIERQGARGFGSGNIKALFEAVEREWKWRGNV